MLNLSNRASAMVAATLVGAGLASAYDALAVEPNALRLTRAVVPASGLRADRLAGLRIAHLSDMHVRGRGWKQGTSGAAIKAINKTDIDFVAITGDFLGAGSGAKTAIEILAGLRADVPRVAVFGNHDHVYGVRHLNTLECGLRELGIIVLSNDAIPLDLPGGRVWVAGVDDPYSHRDDLDAALGRIEETCSPRILLTHYPDLAEHLHRGQVDLSLAGHSHGGQIRIPVLGSIMHRTHARTRYGKGLFWVNGNPLYVSSGIGMSGLPMRFLNPPEVPVITFKATAPFLRTARRYQAGRALAEPVGVR